MPFSAEAQKVRMLMLGVTLLATACSSVASRVPTVPGGASQDITMCEREAAAVEGGEKRSAEKKMVYAACMIARGYETYVAVPLRLEGKRITPLGFGGVPLMVRATRTQSSDTVARDLNSCVDQTLDVLRPEVMAKAGALRGTGAAGFEASGLPARVSSTFSRCLEPRYYRARRWEPPKRF